MASRKHPLFGAVQSSTEESSDESMVEDSGDEYVPPRHRSTTDTEDEFVKSSDDSSSTSCIPPTPPRSSIPIQPTNVSSIAKSNTEQRNAELDTVREDVSAVSTLATSSKDKLLKNTTRVTSDTIHDRRIRELRKTQDILDFITADDSDIGGLSESDQSDNEEIPNVSSDEDNDNVQSGDEFGPPDSSNCSNPVVSTSKTPPKQTNNKTTRANQTKKKQNAIPNKTNKKQTKPKQTKKQNITKLTKQKTRLWKKNKYNPPDATFLGENVPIPNTIQTPYEYFQRFFTADMLYIMIEQTNLYSTQNLVNVLTQQKRNLNK